MIDAHHHHVAVPRQVFAVIGGLLLAGAGLVTAAVNPEHHRPLLVVEARRPDVHAQAILTRLPVVPFGEKRVDIVIPTRPGVCGQVFPYHMALRFSVHGLGLAGGR
jgi:hypothetical protein